MIGVLGGGEMGTEEDIFREETKCTYASIPNFGDALDLSRSRDFGTVLTVCYSLSPQVDAVHTLTFFPFLL